MRPLASISTALLSALTLALTGCANNFNTTASSGPVTMATIQGRTFGGQQPVSGATIQLYQVGTTGYGTGATPLLTGAAVTTASNGTFGITGRYTCTSGTQLYITAQGGNPGAGTNNSLALIAGLGLCDNLSSSTFININEITTVGTVWALAPFMIGSNIGAPTTNQAGLVQAMADVSVLTNTTTGGTPGASLPLGATSPTIEINTLADILASCVNSTGAGDAGTCDKLFANATSRTGVVPTDTVTAAVNIATQPYKNVVTLLSLANSTAPFQPTMAAANDFTVGVTYSIGGFSTPSGLAIDAGGNVWVTNSAGSSVTELSHAGAPLSGLIGYKLGGLNAPSAVAIDASGNAWIANAGNSTVTELSSAGANVSGSPFSGGGLNAPSSVAIDASGSVWLANRGNGTVTALSSKGVALSPAAGYVPAGIAAPSAVAINPR